MIYQVLQRLRLQMFPFLNILLATAAAAAAATSDTAPKPQPPYVNGTWHQVYTNTFVQFTTEIDWRCVVVDVALTNQSQQASIRKKARLHGGPVAIHVTTPVVFDKSFLMFSKDVGVFAPSPPRTHITYNLHPFDNKTWVITGQEEPSVVVWTQDFQSEPQDIARLYEFLDDLGFDPPDDEYKKLIQTYDKNEC